MANLTLQLAASASDVHRIITPSYFNKISTGIQVGKFNASNYQYGAGLYFPNVAIAQGTTIDSATLEVKCRTTYNGATCNTKISAQDADNPSDFTSDDAAAFDARYAARTTAIVSWVVGAQTVDNWYISPDIKTVIQEIVNRPDWVSGNSIVIFWGNRKTVKNIFLKKKIFPRSFLRREFNICRIACPRFQPSLFPPAPHFTRMFIC